MKRWRIPALALAVMLWGGGAIWAEPAAKASTATFIDENGDGIDDIAAFRQRYAVRHGGTLLSVVYARLTEAQRAILQEKINALISAGVSHAEIQNAIFAQLEAFGIDITGVYLDRFRQMLTADQMAALKAAAGKLKASGASYAAIHAAIRTQLISMGVDVYKDSAHSELTQAQLADLQAKVDELVAQGVSRAEIHKAIRAELRAMGVDLARKGTPDHDNKEHRKDTH